MAGDDEREARRRLVRQMLSPDLPGGRAVATAIAPGARPDEVPLSFAQQRLWFLDQLAPGNPFYVETSAFRIRDAIRPRALELSINAVVARHEVLRTSFEAVAGVPVQRIAAELRVPLELVDLTHHSPTRRHDELDRLVGERSTAPFDLTRCPLLTATLVRLAVDDHVLVLAMHHIVTDGRSMQVFGREVSTLYHCLVAGERVELPDLPIQYADYALWQRCAERESAVNGQLEYWRRQLHHLPVLDLPTDHRRPSTVSYRGGETRFVIPAGLADGIKALARSEHATTFMVAFSAWAVLLARYADQHDVAIGVPIAGRDRPELEHLVGCFLNNLVLRVESSDDPTFRQLVARTRKVVVDAFAHQDVPFERLVEELQPTRDLARHPLFQVMFQYFDTDGATAEPVDQVAVRRTTAILDLFMHLWDDVGGIRGKIEYSSDLFDPRTISDMARQYVVVLREAIERPDTRVSRLPLNTRADRLNLVELATGPCSLAEGPISVPDLWDRQVDRTPDGIALIDGSRAWTYCDLHDRVQTIGDLMLDAGVAPQSVVGVCLERSVDAVATLLAITELGCTWVPLDPSYPQQLLDHVVSDSGATVVLTNEQHAQRITAHGAQIIELDRGRPSTSHRRDARARPAADDLACLIYTSGSTGRPKGVMAEHRGIHNRLTWMWGQFPFAPGEVLALKTALSFVDSIWETFGPLLAGVPAVILSDDTVRDPVRLIGELRRHKVTRLLAVPSLLRSLLDSGREIGLELPHLRLWFASGEPLPRDLADRFAAFVPDGTLVNLYGSSEVAGDVTAGWVTPGSSSVDIGHPIANTQIHILDDELEPVPRGVPGRIYAAGANLARGYHRRPGLTAASFVPNPFGDQPGARMYDTGDRGRWLRDDRIEFLGRRDDQVKVRGFRVELGHVEHALLEHPRVTQVAVMLVERSGVDQQLVAYVETDADTADLRSHARLRLPEYMVPGTFVRVADLPLKPNGKIDRSAVAAIAAPVLSEHVFVAPATDAELRMSEMWAELLVADRVGSDDHFFELGGHSLLATRLVSLVRERLDIEMPLTLVFERPILGEMAAALEDLVMAEIDALSDDEMQCEPQT